MNQLVNALDLSAVNLPALFVRTPEASKRFIEFFTANIRNANTRRAYTRATADFAAWCDQPGLTALEDIEPVHVAAYIETLQARLSAPSVKVNLDEVERIII
ncbi:site-specific integrase [Thiorhodococcus mannitoliphagus]|uniref:Site-specific integrase n=1 Tax=Thiorhodococcus mannitoliphagus TaxID=329406 RepID=A0A6P1E4W5_9GAMM|nr:site-specific integrase [Thiorhodococcus mannitoliphagus]NEX23572.1 site-specific integrase [Thiorhodococcus mannitoliphagus]